MDKKLVGLVVTNLAGSGAEKVVLNLFDMFEKKSINVYVFLLEDLVLYNLSKSQESKIVTLSKKRNIYKFLSFLGDKLLSNKLFNRILDIEKKEEKIFDLIISNLPAADRITSLLDAKRNIYYCIHTSYLQEIIEFKKNNKINRALKKEKLYKKIYENKKLVSVSDGIIEDLDKLKINYKSIQTIYNPFNFEYIKQMGQKTDEENISFEYVICASAYRSVKRHDILLSAYKKSNLDEKLVLLCEETIELKTLIKELELEQKVYILGFRKNPYPYIKNAKFLILSSEREGLPTVLIESLILNTPVVSTNCVSGPSEILTGELSKFLSKVNDSDDLAKKINMMSIEKIIIDDKYINKFEESNIYNKYNKLMKV